MLQLRKCLVEVRTSFRPLASKWFFNGRTSIQHTVDRSDLLAPLFQASQVTGAPGFPDPGLLKGRPETVAANLQAQKRTRNVKRPYIYFDIL